ncbi:RNA polymerase sigma factor [Granulicella tundricola]|uniref:RNA polymerase sigma factor SigS n=1 Tax=Granulicella tundricola (strain ATCC BAA-1859 / DSM 23138 / MP5ACTX9) TaxID=1198114 RepID=E8X0P8_GRATM|nr:sigma-70 family RNA polymerase sigma factor [Granulicella tundricola]ADW68999.1 RNA polymerase sigma factor, sigma-70 family [Granulicella tundricola MP5ACTX9]
MTFTELNLHYSLYKSDHTRGHLLCEACRTYAKQLVGANNPDRHEIVADATHKAWTNFNMLPPDRVFAAWFTRIVRNKIRDYHRKARTRALNEEAAELYPESPFTLEQQQEMREKGGPLVSHLLNGYTLKEAADLLDISVRTAKNQLTKLSEEMNSNG